MLVGIAVLPVAVWGLNQVLGPGRRRALALTYAVSLLCVVTYGVALYGMPPNALVASGSAAFVVAAAVASVTGTALFIADLTIHTALETGALVTDPVYIVGGRLNRVGFGIALGIAALEELAFRHYLAESLGHDWVFLLVTALAFGAAHAVFGAYDALSKGLLGLACGIAFVTTSSVIISFVVHASYDYFVFRDRRWVGGSV